METEACCTIDLPEQPMDCDCCPVAPLVAASLVTGDVFVHRYASGDDDASGSGSDDDGGKAAAQRQQRGASASGAAAAAGVTATRVLHRRGKGGASCRAVRFAADGSGVVCGYESGSIQLLDLETSKLAARLPRAHDAGVTRLLCLDTGDAAGPLLVAAGDEDGALRLWDLRQPPDAGPAMRYGKHTDFISGLALRGGEGGGPGSLVVTSGDGTLSVHDMRRKGPVARSEDDADDEFLSVVIMKHGKKVVAGCQSGVLSIFSWGYWNDCSDRFPGHPESVDALVAFDEDTLISGSSDGALRVLSLQPNKLLGIIGEYKDSTPVERLCLSWDHRIAASTSHEATVRLWDLSCLHDDSGGEEEQEEEEEEEEGVEGEGAVAGAAAAGGKKGSGGGGEEEEEGSSGGEGSGGDEEGSGSDDSDSDSDGGNKKRKRKERTRMTKANNKPKKGDNFFADLL